MAVITTSTLTDDCGCIATVRIRDLGHGWTGGDVEPVRTCETHAAAPKVAPVPVAAPPAQDWEAVLLADLCMCPSFHRPHPHHGPARTRGGAR